MATQALAQSDRRLSRHRNERTKVGAEINAFVAQRLKAARRAVGLSQTEAGDHLGLTFQQVQKYERGANRISAGTLSALAELYHRPVAWFFPDPTANQSSEPIHDLPAEFLASPYGVELAQVYLALQDDIDRRAVVIVATALVRKRASS